jgi:uncharacterized membrane protein YbhN (UPF0104 family)
MAPEQKAGLKRRALRLIPVVFYALMILFLVLYLQSLDFSKLRGLHVQWGYLLLATVLGLATRYFGAFIWLTILRSLGANTLRYEPYLVYVYAKAWLGRYIPGTAPWILGKIYFASQRGISKQKLGISSLLEGGIEVVTMLVLSFVLLAFDARLNIVPEDVKLLMIAVAIVGIIALVPPLFNRWVSYVYRLVRHRVLDREHLPSHVTITRGSVLYLATSLINGVSLFFIAKAFYPELGYDDMWFAIGASSLAGAAGMVAFFAPSGLGVREGIQIALFSLIMPTEIALAVTVATRLWIVGVDFVFFGLTRLLAGPATGTPTDAQTAASA